MGEQGLGKTPESPEERIEELTREIERLGQENERLKQLSAYDELSGILNRRGGRDEIELLAAGVRRPEEGEEKRRDKAPSREFSVLLLDIDDFKHINDTYGHEVGDEVIKTLAEFLKRLTRQSDVVARWGGEEFLLAFQGATAQDILNKFFNKAAMKPEISVTVKTVKGDIKVTLSGGATDYIPGEKLDAAIDRADQALYQSKSKGKNVIAGYEEPVIA